MNRSIDEALRECLTRIARGESPEEALQGYESMAGELRPALEAALSLQAKGQSIPELPAGASQDVRARMHAARVRMAERRQPLFGWLPWRAVGLLGAAAAAFALIALATGWFDFGADTNAAQAQGVVASSATDSVVLTTPEGQIVIRIGEQTVILDAAGNVISGEQIAPGTNATIEFEEDDDGLSGVRIEVEDDEDQGGDDQNDGASGAGTQGPEVEFSGVIQSIDANTLVLLTAFGPATVRLDAGTEVNGPLQVGQALKVHAILESSGTYVAREIEIAEAEDDRGGDGPGGSEAEDAESRGDAPANDDPSDNGSVPDQGPQSADEEAESDGDEHD